MHEEFSPFMLAVSLLQGTGRDFRVPILVVKTINSDSHILAIMWFKEKKCNFYKLKKHERLLFVGDYLQSKPRDFLTVSM